MNEPESAEPRRRARVIASALARTAERHRRTAIIAGGLALGGCVLAFFAGATAVKGAALALALLFGVFAFRALRVVRGFLDPAGSPVLRAIAQRPLDIARVRHDKRRSLVVIADRSGAELALHVDADTPADELLDALAAHAPNAEVER